MSTTATIGSMIEKKELKINESEPKLLQEFRSANWSLFLKLPHESDPNMLNFVKTKALNALEITNSNPLLMIPTKSDIKTPETGLKIFISPKKFGSSFAKNVSDQEKEVVDFLPLGEAIETQNDLSDMLGTLSNLAITDKLMALILSTFKWGSYTKLKNNSTLTEHLLIKYDKM